MAYLKECLQALLLGLDPLLRSRCVEIELRDRRQAVLSAENHAPGLKTPGAHTEGS